MATGGEFNDTNNHEEEEQQQQQVYDEDEDDDYEDNDPNHFQDILTRNRSRVEDLANDQRRPIWNSPDERFQEERIGEEKRFVENVLGENLDRNAGPVSRELFENMTARNKKTGELDGIYWKGKKVFVRTRGKDGYIESDNKAIKFWAEEFKNRLLKAAANYHTNTENGRIDEGVTDQYDVRLNQEEIANVWQNAFEEQNRILEELELNLRDTAKALDRNFFLIFDKPAIDG